MRATFNELAERELNEAAQYYEHEQGGLGVAFLLEARRCAEAIASHPQAGTYAASTDDVRILAVMNLYRRPGYWVGRA